MAPPFHVRWEAPDRVSGGTHGRLPLHAVLRRAAAPGHCVWMPGSCGDLRVTAMLMLMTKRDDVVLWVRVERADGAIPADVYVDARSRCVITRTCEPWPRCTGPAALARQCASEVARMGPLGRLMRAELRSLAGVEARWWEHMRAALTPHDRERALSRCTKGWRHAASESRAARERMVLRLVLHHHRA